MGQMAQDFRYGMRMLRKSRGFTAVAVITLALAIGANTAIFSVVYPALLRPLPYRQPDRLVTLGENRRQSDCCAFTSSYPDYLDWKRSAKSFESLAGFSSDGFTLTGTGDPKMVFGAMVTSNFFSTLGVRPMLGRDFVAGDELPEGAGPAVAMLSYNFWRTDFSADPNVIGRTVRLDNKAITVVGVLPRDFEFAPEASSPLWVPLHTNPYTGTARNARWLDVIGRLAPGVSSDQARAEMEAITGQLAQQYPKQDASIFVTIGSLRDEIVGNVRPLLLILFGAVSFVLLIACANVANLLMTRAIDRRREFAIRAALGASRVHLLLQLLSESLLLAMMGAVLGLVGAAVGVRLLVRVIPEAQLQSMPYLRDAGINLAVLAFVCGITLLTALLFGVGPGLAVPQTPITEVLKDESRGGTSGAHKRLRNVVVTGEIALSMVLLVAGGLMLQSLRTLLQQNPGFQPEHLLTFDINLPGLSYPTAKAWPFDNPNGLSLEHEFLDRLRSLPGVRGASATSGLPVTGRRSRNRFVIEGRPSVEGQDEDCVTRRVDASYFATMEIPLLAGRLFTAADTKDVPKVAIVNQAWVRRYVGRGEDAIGKRVRMTFSGDEPFRQVVGVIGDVAEDSLAVPPPAVMYFPVDQSSGYTAYLSYVVRTAGDPEGLVSVVRNTLRDLDPQLAIIQPQSMEQVINRSPAVFMRRYPFYLIGGFGALALALAMIGLYGLISYSVLQRTREIGIRLALGAQREDVLRLILRQGVVAALVGVGIGLVFGLALTRVMASLLYGLNYSAWVVFAFVAILLMLVAITASYFPARRATKVDPIVALRNE
ncbi:MAG TPA: ABC transporter permease [Terriglobales bacterium]|nr:ABC transporter permease [Terriglobales bacterium]